MNEEVSATVPDWSRERVFLRWDPGRYLLRSIRRYQRNRSRLGPLAWASRKWAVIAHRFWSIISGADVPLDTVIGGGLILPHPNGVVVNHEVVIGPNCLLFHQVTLGAGGPIPGVPILGGHVDIGCGAKILGGVRLGDHCRIGANAVVIADVPPGALAVGVPARVSMPSNSVDVT